MTRARPAGLATLGQDGVAGVVLSNSINLADVFVGMASRWPDRKAVISTELNLSYKELVARAARTSRELQSRGVRPAANIGIALRDNAECLVCMIAAWMLRATAVPLDFRANPAERRSLAEEFDLAAIIEDRPIQASGYVPVLLDSAWGDTIAEHDATPLWPSKAKEDAAAFISLTSGTTGRPKGILIDHERMLLRSTFDAERLGGPLLNPLPLSFSASRTHVFSALLQGAGVHFYPLLFSPQQLADTLRTGEVTSLCTVPTIIRNLFELLGETSSPAFPRLEALYCFGAPMAPAEKTRAQGQLCANFVQVYGASICGRISTLSGSDLEARPETLGRPLPHLTLQLVDADDRVLRIGEVGTIRLRSPGMATGIYGSAQASGDSFKDGWAYPGDIGVIDQDGFLQLLGRNSDLIIRGGANVHPSEVEGVIAECAGVQEVAVVGFTKLPEGEEIAAFVVGGAGLTEAALIAHCRARLGPDKRPRKFVLVKDLPRNVNGKISRADLRRQLEAIG